MRRGFLPRKSSWRWWGWWIGGEGGTVIQGEPIEPKKESTEPKKMEEPKKEVEKIEPKKVEEDYWVSVWPGGKYYHILPCPNVKALAGARLMKIEDAKKRGYEPCPACTKSK